VTIILYHSVESTCAQKVRLVLSAKSLEWQGRKLNLRRGDQFAPEYLALNPKGVVPTLVHDETVLRESTVINEYLDDTFPDPALKPGNPADRAVMRLWVKTFDDDVHPAIGVTTYATVLRHQMAAMKTPEELAAHFATIPDPARRARQQTVHELGLETEQAAQALRQLDGVLARMDNQLNASPWLAGKAYSLADCAAAPYILRLEALQFAGLWADRAGLARWFARIKEHPDILALKDRGLSPSLQDMFKDYGGKAWPMVDKIVKGRGKPAGRSAPHSP
jgi:glutathione S-transferase